jgi:hypothetical protein
VSWLPAASIALMSKPAFLTSRPAARGPVSADRAAAGSPLRTSWSPAALHAVARACAMGLIMPPPELWMGRDRKSLR